MPGFSAGRGVAGTDIPYIVSGWCRDQASHQRNHPWERALRAMVLWERALRAMGQIVDSSAAPAGADRARWARPRAFVQRGSRASIVA